MRQLDAEARPDEMCDRRGLHAINTGDMDVFLGLDVGKGEHHATSVVPAGKKALDKRLPNTDPKLRELFAKLRAEHGTVLGPELTSQSGSWPCRWWLRETRAATSPTCSG
ncbi:transposase [Streptomyces sp. ITFR-16]|nr:transposase [Streptomyces sp. ITFR-16]WNI26154.1 transposase [Streptomyces sp. ITFR-16]